VQREQGVFPSHYTNKLASCRGIGPLADLEAQQLDSGVANNGLVAGFYTFALAFLQFTQALRVMETGTRRRLESSGPGSRPLSAARCLRRGSELVDSDVDWLGLLLEALLSATDGLMVRRVTFSKSLRGIAKMRRVSSDKDIPATAFAAGGSWPGRDGGWRLVVDQGLHSSNGRIDKKA
jgi:hypothetical protein